MDSMVPSSNNTWVATWQSALDQGSDDLGGFPNKISETSGLVLAKNLWRSLASRQFSPLTVPTDTCLHSAVMPSRFARVHALKVVLDLTASCVPFFRPTPESIETRVSRKPDSPSTQIGQFSTSSGHCDANLIFGRERQNP
jgi:hypothetical protein